MPGWSPDWSDIRFDHAAAATAAAACRAAARRVDAVTDAHVRAFDTARTDWTGRAEQHLGARADELTRTGGELIQRLDAAARAIEDAASEAEQRQAHREAERERWREERRLEQAQRDLEAS
jgi:hypothetical protein